MSSENYLLRDAGIGSTLNAIANDIEQIERFTYVYLLLYFLKFFLSNYYLSFLCI